MTHRTTAKKDERGAILVVAAVGLVMALIMGGLAVDLGFIAQEARQDQKIADLAAMDAARALPADPTDAARESAQRNGFDDVNGPNFVVEAGTYSSGVFTPTAPAAATAVRVSVTSTHDNQFPFLGDDKEVTRRGIATNSPTGGFSIGSSLATIDPSRSALLNRFMGGILRGSTIGAGVVSWQGLVSGHMTLEALRYQLGTMGFSVGTVDEMLDANLTLAQLLQASAQAMALQGPTGAAQATILNAIRGQITSTTLTTFKLGRFIDVRQGSEEAALASTVNLFQFVTAGAQVANGTNLISVTDVGITVPNVTSTKATLKVIEPPKFYFGPEGGSVTTSQVELTVTPTLDLPITVLGLAGVRVTQDLPIKLSSAGAVGTLKDVDCAASTMTVNVDPYAISGSASTNLVVNANVFLVGNIPILRIPTTAVTPSTDGGPTDLVFSYPSEFPPPLGTETSKHAGSQPVGLGSLTQFNMGTPVVLNAIAAPLLSTIVNAVGAALPPLVGEVDTRVFTPLLGVLGLDLGSADVTALKMKCGTPTLVG